MEEYNRHEALAPSHNTSQIRDLNETLDAEYIDLAEDDTSFLANVTRKIAKMVSRIFTPRTMLIVLRLLKAITVVFLGLTVVADVLFLGFLLLGFTSAEVAAKMGGTRDTIIRLYGLGLAVVALCIEMDMAGVVVRLPALRGFIPRAFLLFFIAVITNASPLHERKPGNGGFYDNYGYTDEDISDSIPGSTVMMQSVTSIVVGCCAFLYLVLGCMCFDRFTSKAFLSKRDIVEATKIPQTAGNQVFTQGATNYSHLSA